MNNNDRDNQRTNFWGGKAKIGSDGKPLEISHTYGTYGNNRNYFTIETRTNHRMGPNSFHGIHGFKTNGGSFNRPNPYYQNYWNIIRRFLGY